MMIYAADKAYAVAREESDKQAVKFIELIGKDIEEASKVGVTRIKEHEVQSSMLLGLITFLIEGGYQVDYEEDGDMNTGTVSYPTYCVTIDWSGRLEEMEDEDE